MLLFPKKRDDVTFPNDVDTCARRSPGALHVFRVNPMYGPRIWTPYSIVIGRPDCVTKGKPQSLLLLCAGS